MFNRRFNYSGCFICVLFKGAVTVNTIKQGRRSWRHHFHLALSVHSILAVDRVHTLWAAQLWRIGLDYTTVTGQGELQEAERLGKLASIYWDVAVWYLFELERLCWT